jgi:hypothetical protein
VGGGRNRRRRVVMVLQGLMLIIAIGLVALAHNASARGWIA